MKGSTLEESVKLLFLSLIRFYIDILCFQVLSLQSLRVPKRITIRGDDEREYKFLVKGGEDLRLDQRIEQV